MKTYIISYVTNGGIWMMNTEVIASNRLDAINELKNDTGVQTVLSCFEKPNTVKLN